MIETVNLQEVKEKLYQKLDGTGWNHVLKTFILSSEMDIILNTLLKDARDSKRFTPPIKHIFRAFEACPFDKVRVVIIGQDPYPQIDTADGIAFSCSIQNKAEASLRYILNAIKSTVHPEEPVSTEYDLTRWAEQGVLLLNSALTTTIGKPGTHYLLWRPFLLAVLDALVWNKQELSYTFLGKKAQEYADIIPSNNQKLLVAHPASAAYTGQAGWDCGDMFNQINIHLMSKNEKQIVW